jgi:MATE family multidrug resistance protein
MLAFLPLIGIGNATSVIVGQYIGKGRGETVERVTANSLKIAASYSVFMALLFWLCPDFFIALFRGDDRVFFAEVRESAIWVFRIMPLFLMGDCLSIIYGSALAGAGDTRYKMAVSSISSAALYIPGQILIFEVFGLPVMVGWVWTIFYIALVGFLFLARFRRGNWRRIDLIS